MLILFIYLFITEIVFSSSQELEFDINFVSLENLGPALEAFKGINLAGCCLFFFQKHIIHNFCKGKIGTKFSE